MGDPQLTKDQNKVFQPIFYKGTTLANYEEAMHVLSCNNCVLMDDLFGNYSTKGNCDVLVAKKLMKKLELKVVTINYMKKFMSTMLKINCILRVPASMIFCHLTKIPMTYQGIRIIL
jgi:hypothetical protein